ncbi:hypothetical protein FRC00_002550 [Tulasnella sp. 408]|nr:hypothetical protein FRC00_002550 [Tulasnella sp. 408]
MIRKSRNIEELILSGIEDDVESQNGILWPEETQVTTLSKLKRIRITNFQFSQAVGCVLRCIDAPNITDVFISEDRENQSHEGLITVKALMIDSDMGRQSILTSMLCEASNMESLKLKGFRESMILGLDDPVKDLYCKVYLSVSEDDWEEALVVMEGVASYFDLPVRLHFG